jgi:ribosomal-protein-alanine N-acetyltransferase
MRLDDLDRVYRIERELFTNPWPQVFFENDLVSKETVAFVVEVKDTVIGYSLATCIEGKFHVTNIAVDKNYQRQGIATHLMQKLEDVAVEKKCYSAYLEVRPDNEAAINLYRKLGYSLTHIRKHYYIDDDDAYVMQKELR